jgi:predicted aspartyl protease
MAITFLKAKVIHLERPKRLRECKFLADSGAVYSVVPQSILTKLGIEPTSFEGFVLANGAVVRKPVGNAYLEHADKCVTARFLPD